MNPVARVDAVCDRERLLELSYSLYECLTDLVSDTEALEYIHDPDADGLVERISISAMNCLADMKLLVPMFNRLVRLRDING